LQAEKQPNSEQELVAMAREGDPDAFGELVRRHRAKAIGVAKTLTRDTHLAEDIVQEALVKAFLKLGSLVDEKRFAMWLSRIVRNEAYMKLRRGGPHGKERPFTAWTGFTNRGTTPADVYDAAAVRSVLRETEHKAAATRAIELLKEAKNAETEGVALLALMLELLEREA
jgi:RNA polymerase sigma factor (sigma-70 family)